MLLSSVSKISIQQLLTFYGIKKKRDLIGHDIHDPEVQEIIKNLRIAQNSIEPNIHPYVVHANLLEEMYYHQKDSKRKGEIITELLGATVYRGEGTTIKSLAFSPNNEFVAGASQYALHFALYKVKNKEFLDQPRHKLQKYCIIELLEKYRRL